MNENDKVDPIIGNDSPDFLAAPKRGKGVRRLNRVPLFIIGGLAILAFAAVSYTFIQRQGGGVRGSTAEIQPGSVTTTAVPAVRPENFGPLEPPTPDEGDPVEVTPSDPMPDTGPAPDPVNEDRLRLLQRIEENKFAAMEAALTAEPTVAFGSSSTRNSSNTGAGNAGTGPGAGMALAGLTGAGTGARGRIPSGLGLDALGVAGAGGNADPNRQDHKRSFLSLDPTQTYLPHTRLPAISDKEVKAGTIIPGVMIGGINSDLPGQIVGQVRQNVYDTASGQHLLIPAGARLVGTYDSTVTLGQRRVLVAWNRVIYPDGSSVSLDMMPGADQSGFAGFADKVNNHYWRIFGNAFMLSLFSAGIQLSQPDGPRDGGTYDSQQIMAAELGRQLGQLGMEMSRRNMDIQPTLEIRPGYKFNIMITKDIILPSWTGHPLASTAE
ncbi:hypothetical protein KYK30_31385 [Shinella yambaruensis]|uniref:Conjugal transfer protein TrbI n=1 Tax=Shinella yambaruensis TaxID=415996 RepID=A0ABQ5ZTV3_9HYPH|nr:TrbI/VirB10 family protein [Shinella yambaruensis]MCJ8029975.1 hypothetical protein [Shinella yambaruensis]MCU7984227.1 hypothetical protein [Shinella yambaruensis]GLR55174.1 conjugal transfer protein TrbI [Shinella yambaruensis]